MNMLQRASIGTQARPWRVTLIVLVTMLMAAQWTGAQTPGLNFEEGDVCVQHYQPGAVCTAEDVRIASISPEIQDVCLTAGDVASAVFTVQIVTNATDRYDIGVFVATDGGSALSGNSCYHDFLQPATDGPWDFVTTFRNTDGDVCADTRSTDTDAYYTFQQEIQILCVDANGDGVVDPFSTCTSWDNNASSPCLDVTDAVPGTSSKCRCEMAVSDPPILLYAGYDWGDLPDSYNTYTESDGARHAIQDYTNSGSPQTLGGIPAVWLGTLVDYSPNAESNGQPDDSAVGDDTNDLDDEDGIAVTGYWSVEYGGQIAVDVNSSEGTCTDCRLGFWFDWDNSGTFDEEEGYVQPVDYGSQTVTFDIPAMPPSSLVLARFRLYDGSYVGPILPTGVVTNGEVEDYVLDITPTAVTMLWFEATSWGDAILTSWKTASEIDNLGFNVYRAESPDAEPLQLNDALLPSESPGSLIGYVYHYLDRTATPGVLYYYWLEAVDSLGGTERHGPVSAVMTPRTLRRVYLPVVK